MESRSPDSHLVLALKSFARAASVLVVLVGGLVFVGWALDVDALKTFGLGPTAMKANTALAFVLAGVSLGLPLFRPADRLARYVALGCALAVALIGLLSLSEYLVGWDLGIDQILFRDQQTRSGLPPGRMAPATALGFVLVGFSLLGLTVDDRRGRALSQCFAVIAAVLGLVALFGYFYDAASLYTFDPYVSVALHTAILLVVLSAGILAAQPTFGLMALVTGEDAGGYLARRMLPAVLGVPLLLGWLALAGERAGLYESPVRLILTVVSSIIVLTATVLGSARSLQLIDAERQRGEEALRESEERLRAVLETVVDGIITIDEGGRVQSFNPAAEGIFGYSAGEVLGQNVTMLMPEPYRSEHDRYIESYLRTGVAHIIGFGREVAGRRKDGSTFTLDLAVSEMRLGGHRLFTGMVRDITEHKRVEAERERLLAELEATVESAPAGVVTYDSSGRSIRMNAAAERIMGYTDEEMALPMAELVARLHFEAADGRPLPPEEFPPIRALRGERVNGVAIAFHRTDEEDDRKVWIYDGAGPIRARDGTILGAVASFVDVTELRELQEQQGQLLDQLEARAAELALERDRLRTLVESIADAVFVCNAQGNITLANAAGISLVGAPSAEARLNLADYMRTLQLQYPDGRTVPLDELAITRALSGVTERGREEVGVHPTTHRRVDLFISAAPLRDAYGRVVGAVEVAADITRVRELADAAQRRAAELQGVLDNMVDPVFVCSREGRIVLSNPAATRLLGLPSFAEIRNLPAEFPTFLHLRHPDGLLIESSEMATARALAGQTVVDSEQVIHSPSFDQDRYVRVSAAPIRDAESRIVGAVVVVRDVTALTELDRLKDEFLVVAAHELKTPVTIMKGYAQTLARASFDLPSPARRMIDAIDRGADRINRIVQDLLDITRLQAGQLELADERVDLPALAEAVVDRFALTTSRHRLRVVQADPAVVRGDRNRIGEVLADLLDNAVRYSPAGGDVDVAVRVEGDRAIVSVRDQGVGIPRGKQAHIFERFYRAHTRTQYDYGGMGVGLYIAREVIARHGGQMWFESEEGQGSTFYISLPLSRE